jgi:hypothetical protein
MELLIEIDGSGEKKFCASCERLQKGCYCPVFNHYLSQITFTKGSDGASVRCNECLQAQKDYADLHEKLEKASDIICALIFRMEPKEHYLGSSTYNVLCEAERFIQPLQGV